MNNKTILIILGSIAIAVLAIFVIQRMPYTILFETTPETRVSVPPAPPPTSQTIISGKFALPIAPPKNAPLAQWEKFKKAIAPMTRKTDTVRIEECQMIPTIAKVKRGATLMFQNQDGVSHKVAFGESSFEIVAGAEKQVSVSLKSPFAALVLCDSAIGGYVVE